MQAGGHPAGHARLGIIEQQLDEMTGTPGVINMVAADAVPHGKVKGTALRYMTMAAAVRAVLLTGLMPEACCGEVLQALFGDAIEVGDLRLGSIDGSVTRMADTPANRAEFGSAGTADDSAPTRSCGTCRSPTPPPAACSP